jgi:sigma-B regulation protein RsbU (phosphoserine phosphatase)
MPHFNECLLQHMLQCMEIWGGSDDVEKSVSTPGLDLWVSSRPYQEACAGGDVHYVSLCGGGVVTRFILADVAGHGAAVADVARQLRKLTRENINRKSHDRLVRELNRQFTELSHAGRFATAVVGTYLATTRKLTIGNAGHPRPLWYHAAIGDWSLLTGGDEKGSEGAGNLPFGIDGQAAYDQREIPLAEGDFLLFYTDALVEAVDPQDKPLGENGLLDLIRRLDLTAPEQASQSLIASLNDYRGARGAEDDQTFLLLRHTGRGPRRMSVREKLGVYAKVIGLKRV